MPVATESSDHDCPNQTCRYMPRVSTESATTSQIGRCGTGVAVGAGDRRERRVNSQNKITQPDDKPEQKQCEAKFEPPVDAPHKLFCCAQHRFQYHDRRRAAAVRSLADLPASINSSTKAETEL